MGCKAGRVLLGLPFVAPADSVFLGFPSWPKDVDRDARPGGQPLSSDSPAGHEFRV